MNRYKVANQPWHQAVIPSELAEIRFELHLERDLRLNDGAPVGEIGEITPTAEGVWHVAFALGCKVILELDQHPTSSGNWWHGSLTVSECSVSEPFIIVMRALLRNDEQPYFMIPSTLYGSNNADRGVVAKHTLGVGRDPKLTYRAPDVGITFSHSWHWRADHSTIPSVSAQWDTNFVAVTIEENSRPQSSASGAEWLYNSLGVWTDEVGDSITVALGSLDWPYRIFCGHKCDGRVVEPINQETAAGLSARIGIYSATDTGNEQERRFAYEPLVELWYSVLHEPPREGPSAKQALREVATALVNHCVSPRTGHFCMLRTPDSFHDDRMLVAWAGVLQIARPLLLAGHTIEDNNLITVAEDAVDAVVAGAINSDSGLFHETFTGDSWVGNVWWPGLGHPALVSGHACYLLLQMAETVGERASSWVDAARQVVTAAVQHQRTDGRLPHGFSPLDGSPQEWRGFGGCFFVAPMLAMARIDENKQAAAAGRRALEHYWAEFCRLEWIGVDLDCAGAQDCGSSFALARALTMDHRQSGDPQALERLGHVLRYACTYRFGHNTRHRNPVCDWSSSGAQVTSTHNIHLDAYGGLLLEDMTYYLEHREDSYLSTRLSDSLAWARQAYNRTNGEYGWGEVGFATEQYYHTYDAYHYFEGDGTVWQATFPWSMGALMETFLVEIKRYL